jgi:HlyD family secretion protein
MLQLRVDVRFEDLPHVKPGQPVRIDNPALAAPIVGKVLFTSSMANIQKNTVQVKVAIEQLSPLLKPEMLVDCTFLAPDSPKSETGPSEMLRLYVPKSLVQSGDKGHYVWVADTFAGVARKQPVELGPTVMGGMVEITAGLTVSSKLIAAGREGLHDGSRILITSEDEAVGK